VSDAQQYLSRSARRKLKNPALHLARMLERGVEYKAAPGLTARPQTVRVAGREDVPGLWHLLELEAKEHALASVDWDKVRRVMELGLRRDGNVIGIIDAPGKPGELAATVGINLMQPWYSEEWCCEEIWSFVHPDYRKASSNYASMLIDFAKWWAEALEVPLFMGVISTQRTLGKVRLYARQIQFIGGMFLHNFPPAKVSNGKE
jgi:hypothetical protein